MAASLETGFSAYNSCEANFKSKAKGCTSLCSSAFGTLQLPELSTKDFLGKSLNLSNQIGFTFNHWNVKDSKPILVNAQASIRFRKGMRWWEKTLKLNMICQLAESNPDAIFLKLNYEELKSMCHTLHIHVLPFFRFYRGARGKVCSFSCTNATIKKFKDALARYGTDQCSLGPAKGLDESELLALASIGLLSRNSSSSLDRSDNRVGLKEGKQLLMA